MSPPACDYPPDVQQQRNKEEEERVQVEWLEKLDV